MRKSNLITCLLASACLTLAMSPGVTMAQDPNPQTQDEVFNLRFKGGSVGEYADAIRVVAPTVNIVIMPNASIAPVPALNLQSVSVDGALNFLNGRQYQIGRETIELSLDYWNDGTQGGRRPVYTIGARGAVEPSRSLVVSVQGLLDNMSQDDLLTAIEVALEMVSANRAPAAVKFHAATNILLVQGHPEQIGIVEDMLGELFSASNRQKADQQNQEKVSAMGFELRELRAETQNLQVQMNQSQLKQSEWETRYAMLNDQNQTLQRKLAQIEVERRQCLDHIATLDTQISQLQQDKNINTDKN